MSSKITIDIETLPDLRPGAREQFIKDASENIKVPSGATKESLAADLGITDKDEIKFTPRASLDARWVIEIGPTHAEPIGDAEWRKTSFSGLLGRMFCIGVAIDDEPAFILAGDETTMLNDFKRVVTDVVHAENMGLPLFIGHNLTDFDLPFIFHRSVLLGIEPHPAFPIMPSRYSERVYDTMARWAGFGNRIKLDTLAQAFGVGSKGDIDGSMAYDYYVAGRTEDLKAYCENDVEMTRAVYKRMSFN